MYVCMYACTHVRTYVCMYACMYVCMYVRTYVCMCVCMCVYVCMYVCMYVSLYLCVYVCMYGCVCMCVCMYVCMYARTYVCMYVCMCVCLIGQSEWTRSYNVLTGKGRGSHTLCLSGASLWAFCPKVIALGWQASLGCNEHRGTVVDCPIIHSTALSWVKCLGQHTGLTFVSAPLYSCLYHSSWCNYPSILVTIIWWKPFRILADPINVQKATS